MPGPGAGLAVLLRPLTLGGAAADPVTCVGVAAGSMALCAAGSGSGGEALEAACSCAELRSSSGIRGEQR